jgi:CRISPR-associated protein Csd1
MPAWREIFETGSFLSFRFSDERGLFCQNTDIARAIGKTSGEDRDTGICLVSGENDRVCELHTAIKGVYGAQTSGANIVSFNLDAFRSFGKKQGLNAPVGYSSMFAYTTALNTLLSKDSTQRMQVGDSSTVFWSSKQTRFESDFLFFFDEPKKDNPDEGTRRIRSLLEAPNTGAYTEDNGDGLFYVLGLAPNAARIAIRFWQVGTVSDFAGRIRQHFEDLRIVKPPHEPEFYSLWRLLVNIAVQDKSENIPPNVAGDFMRSILNGTSLSRNPSSDAVRRIKSDPENRVKSSRAALLKAFLNRALRVHPDNKNKEIAMALDTEQPSVGYQLGRLFATLEKIQEEAGNPSTIRERYYGAACSAPVTVFGTLMRLKNHHLAKIENKGRAINFERLLGEITGRFNDFPTHLNLSEQGRFAIGYYHQRQDFFTKKDETK